MKQFIIIFSFLSIFSSLFAQQDTSITIREYRTQRQGKITIQRDTIVRGYKSKTLALKRDSLYFANGRFQKVFNDSNRNYKVYSAYGFDNYDTLSKEITTEVACNPDATIFIENINRKLIIKTSPDNKVRITTTINYSADDKLSDEAWFQSLNLQLKSNNNQVVLKSDNTFADNSLRRITTTVQSSVSTTTRLTIDTLIKENNPPAKAYSINGLNNSAAPRSATTIRTDDDRPAQAFTIKQLPIFDGNGNWVNKRSNIQHVVTVYIPAGAKIDVESKYADVEIQNDLKNLKADITNASLRFMNVETADIQSKYGRINAGNIKKADIELTNGKFYAKNIYSAKFDSKYSNIEFGIANDLKIESINDQYEIDEVADLTANKNYGNIRITNLKNSFNLTGNNADIKVRNIAAELNNIKIDDKYADIRLPLNNITNYSVDFDGKTCNVYAPFEKVVVFNPNEKMLLGSPKKEPPTAKQTDDLKNGFKTLSPLTINNLTINKIRYVEGKDNAFKATVGDVKGKHAELQFKCINCTVDFK